MSLGLLFPGQGSQQVGMGQALAERFPVARRTFAEADELLGFSLSRIAWEGPPEDLVRTDNAQPALFVHSLAVHRVMADRLGEVAAGAGHSLGELSAHAAAGTLSFADGLRIVRTRGTLMASAGERAPGSMAALLGIGEEGVEALCAEARTRGMTLVAANLNAKGQIVVSGDESAIAWVLQAARAKGAKRAVRLAVSAAFHSPLMAPAAAEFEAFVDEIEFHAPAFPVISNVTAQPAGDDPTRIRALLVRQLTAPVRWRACVACMMQLGVDRFMELGQGSVLAGLNRRNAPDLPATSLGTPESIEEALSTTGALASTGVSDR